MPNGAEENKNLALYTEAMREAAAAHGIRFVDAYSLTETIYKNKESSATQDGFLLNSEGYAALAEPLATAIFGPVQNLDRSAKDKIKAAVAEKNFLWIEDFKIPNGVHVYGRRYNPYGPENYPHELKKVREMTAIRDEYILATAAGKDFDLGARDAKTYKLPPVKTNYKVSKKNGTTEYLKGTESKTKINVPEGYKVELFADENRFPDLANPVQMSFDNKGRLWVATMQSYPHYRIGDPRPQDKLLIFEDTDNDGKADKQITWANDLHIPIGFEIAHDGVYVSQGANLVFLQDTDGDDSYDKKTVIMSGFDDHDTHHAISAFCADPSGAIHMAEGVFLHSNIETAYGPIRGSNGGFFRYQPQQKKLIRHAQFSIPNPWGIAFDDYGQEFFLHTSGPSFAWTVPGTARPLYGVNVKSPDLLTSNQVRPTSGLEFVSSRHFPDEVQGDVLINNNIGFLGAKQHKVMDDGAGFTTEFRQDLFRSDDLNFRPTDLEFAPDGSLYFVDWHNALIGHMQHNARDPMRDHEHGRIYRITYPSRPLVTPAKIDGASTEELLELLKLPEYRTRYRAKRELRGHDATKVHEAVKVFVKALTPDQERIALEALWVTWGANRLDEDLLSKLLSSGDHRIRAAAANVLRFNTSKIANADALLKKVAKDPHGRVRVNAVVAASWMDKSKGKDLLELAKQSETPDSFEQTYEVFEKG